MNLNVKALKTAIGKVFPIVSKNPVIPVMSCIKMEVLSDKIVFTSTDTERTVSSYIDSANIDTYSVCVPASIFYDTVKSLADSDDIEFVFDEKANMLLLKTRTGKFKISVESCDDFPKNPDEELEELFEIATDALQKAITKTAYCISTDSIRLAMTGVYMEVGKNQVTFTSTDAHSLASVSFKLERKKETEVLIPGKALSHLQNLTENGIPVTVSLLGKNKVVFHNNTFSYSLLLVDAKYPAYRSVIPADGEKALVEKDLILGSVKRVSLFTNKSTKQTVFLFNQQELKISGMDIDFGLNGEELIACESELDSFTIGLNYFYVLEVLKRIEKDEVVFNFNNPNQAVTINESDEFSNSLFLIMPLMVVG